MHSQIDRVVACYHGHEIMVMKKKGPLVVRERAAFGDAGRVDTAPSFSREISAGEFKARCLALMDEVRDRGGEYMITKRGVAVAKLVPVRQKRRQAARQHEGHGHDAG